MSNDVGKLSNTEGLALNSVDGKLIESVAVFVTSEQGHRIAKQDNITFQSGLAEGNVLEIFPKHMRQTVFGIGCSFTESSAFVLAHLQPEQRIKVMDQIFSERGANFSMARMPIGACDFCVEGRFSYADTIGDINLDAFDIKPDKDGFKQRDYPGIRDEHFDLLPMIHEAQHIKQAQQDSTLRLIASAWTAPSWMKDIEDWYQPGSAANNYSGGGGVLKPEYLTSYAMYLAKYLDAYRERGVDCWGLTPVNEPGGNNGQWESMHFTAESQNTFIKEHLGPVLKQTGNDSVNLLIFDHNSSELEEWADTILGDPDTNKYVSGAAVHWYDSTVKVYDDVFDRVHEKFPDYTIIHTEGCIDDLGKPAPEGISDPERFQESHWFDNDDFWWNENATDWGYSATWPTVIAEDHPIYTPVHRYARHIIVGMNHWVSGWVDWNIVLDQRGGPNHVGNYCGAPIMIDVETQYVYYTPIFYILAQLSQTIRPGDQVVGAELRLKGHSEDALYATASISPDQLLSIQVFNTQKHSLDYSIQIGAQFARVVIEPNALQTIQIQL